MASAVLPITRLDGNESTVSWHGPQRYKAGTAGGTTAATLAVAVLPARPAVLPLRPYRWFYRKLASQLSVPGRYCRRYYRCQMALAVLPAATAVLPLRRIKPSTNQIEEPRNSGMVIGCGSEDMYVKWICIPSLLHYKATHAKPKTLYAKMNG